MISNTCHYFYRSSWKLMKARDEDIPSQKMDNWLVGKLWQVLPLSKLLLCWNSWTVLSRALSFHLLDKTMNLLSHLAADIHFMQIYHYLCECWHISNEKIAVRRSQTRFDVMSKHCLHFRVCPPNTTDFPNISSVFILLAFAQENDIHILKDLDSRKVVFSQKWIVYAVVRYKYFWNWYYMTWENRRQGLWDLLQLPECTTPHLTNRHSRWWMMYDKLGHFNTGNMTAGK